MSQPPEYQRQSQIEPVGTASGAAQAFEPNMEKVRGHLGWADFGRELAQGSANERAKLNAIEAAQNPGQQLLPAITETDKVFHQVYKEEELQVVSSHANSLLQKIYQEADSVQTPSMSTLEEFQKNAMEGFGKFLEQVSPENKPRLERALTSAYEANYAQLAVKLEKYNMRLLNAQYNKGIDQDLKDVQNYRLMGNDKAAEDAKNRALAKVGALETLGHDLPYVAEKKREGIKEADQISYYQRKTEEAIKDGKYESFIRKLREDPPDHLTPLVRENVIKASMQYANQYQAALTGQQNLEYLTYQKAMVEGSLSPTMMAEGEKRMGANHFAQLQLQLAKKNSQDNELNVLTSKIMVDSNDIDKMSQYTSKEVSDVYRNLVAQYEQSYGMEPGSLPLTGQAEIAELIKAPNPVLKEKVQARLVGGDSSSAAEAAQIVAAMEKNNPLVLSGLSKQEHLLALGIDTAVSLGMQPELAVELKRQRVLGLDAKGIEENENKYSALTKGSKAGSRNFDDPNKALAFVAGTMGYDKSLIPVGVTEKFLGLLKDNYVTCGDWNDAVKATQQVFDRSYGETTINGRKEVMYAPPEKFVPLGESAHNLIRNQSLQKFQEISETSKEMYDKNGSQFYYEVDKRSLAWLQYPDRKQIYEENPELRPQFRNDTIKIKRIWRNGNVDEGELVMSSDRFSTIPENGTMPSYWLGMEIKGKKSGIIDPKDNSNVRLQPNVSKYVESRNKAVEKEREAQRKRGKEHEETRKTIRGKQQELNENPVPGAFDL